MKRSIFISLCGVCAATICFGFINGDDFTPGEFKDYPNGYENVRDYTNDYTRTVVENFMGHEGATYIKWTKLGAKPYGRAWAMKFDMTKGFQLCAATSGKLNSPRATVPAMADYLKTRGKDPICGINCDYFTYDANGPYSYTIFDSQVLTRGQDKGGRFNVLLMETGDHKVKIGEVGRTDGKGTMAPIAHSYDVVDAANAKLKVRNSVRVNLYHYPAKDGKVWRPINPAHEGAGDYYETYPVSLVGTGKDPQTGNDIVVLFEADGRDSTWSYGVIADVACQMLFDEGCTEVGEFDGGGSASFWAKETDSECGRTDGLVNKSTDGSARSVGNAVFIVAPETRQPVATINGINTYYDFDEVLLALAPNEPIVILGEAACTGACAFDRSCSVSGAVAGAKIVCASQPTVAAGVTVALKDVAFAASNDTLSVASGAKVTVAGACCLGVNTAEAAAFEVKGALTADVTVNCATATKPGQAFGFSPLASVALATSLAHLKHPTIASLAAEAVDDGNGGSILRWVPDAHLNGFSEKDGYNFTNRVISITVATVGAHVVAGSRKVRLTVRDLAGAEILVVDKPLTVAGTYEFNTSDSGVAIDPQATYLCEVTIVTDAGQPVEDADCVHGVFDNGAFRPWFSAAPGSAVGGAWNTTPVVKDGAYAIDSFSSDSVFTASEKTDDVKFARVVSDVVFPSGTPIDNLDSIVADFSSNLPYAMITVVELADETLAWYALAKVDSQVKFIRLYGLAAETDLRYLCRQDVIPSGAGGKVRYGVSTDGGATWTTLADANGAVWFESASTAALTCEAGYRGRATLYALDGERLTADLATVDGTGYASAVDALAAAKASGVPVELLTNMIFQPDDVELGEYGLSAGNWKLRWYKGGTQSASLNAENDKLTVKPAAEANGLIILFH